MIRQRWLALLGFAGGALVVSLSPATWWFVPAAPTGHPAPAMSEAQRWACPMLDYVGDHPGTCPVCGMTLQRAGAGDITPEQARRLDLQLSTVTAGPAVMTVHAYGAVRLDEREEYAVIPRVAGRITRRYPGALHTGTEIAAGDPLVDLYSPEVLAAQAELAAARASGPAAIAGVRSRFVRWNLAEVADAVLAGASPVDTVTVRAPTAGRVIVPEDERAPVVGRAMAADEVLVRVADPHRFQVIIHVPEPRARMLRVGTRVELASDDAGPLPDVSATVAWVAPNLDPEIRARAVHLHVEDAQGRVLPGSLVEARFRAVQAQDGSAADPADPATWGTFPLIPASAVLSTGVRQVVWVPREDAEPGRQRFKPVVVALGQRLEDAGGEDRWVVRAGLQAGDKIVTRGAFLIDSQAQLAGSPSLLNPTAVGHAP